MLSVKRSEDNGIQQPSRKHQKNSSSQISNILILPNEIITTVFKYLKPCEILHSFSNLNRRFTSLIYHFKQNVNLCKLTDEQIAQILPLIRKDVVSLKINKVIFINVENGDLLQQFPSLQQLSVLEINLRFSKQLLPFVQSFKHLPKLQLQCRDDKEILPGTRLIHNEFLPHIFQHDSLVKEFSIRPCSKLSDTTIETFSPCNLTKLDIHLTNGRDLFILFSYIPKIEVFKCGMSYFILKEDMAIRKNTATPTIYTPHLREFSLENKKYTTDFTTIVSFLKDRLSLERLSLNLQLRNESKCVDGSRLHEELLPNLINLKSFGFNFTISYDRSAKPDVIKTIIGTFQTDFWLKEHDWKVGVCYCSNYISQSMHLFSLPYTFSHFAPIIKNPNFTSLETTTSVVSSDLFDNVRSLCINKHYDDDADFFTLKFVATYFKKIACISWHNNHYPRTDPRSALPTELIDLRLPTVKKLKYYDYGGYKEMKQLFPIFLNLTELVVAWDDLLEAHDYICNGNHGEDLLQLKNLQLVKVDPAGCQHGDQEIEDMNDNLKRYFIEHLPGIELRFPIYNDEIEESEEEDTDDDTNDN